MENNVQKNKIFIIASVARQVDGEMCIVKMEKAFKQASKADEYAKSLNQRYTETITTPHGQIPCVCSRGVFEVEVDETE